ncbi:tRNA (adenosine(37)-N6)-threonylcarbamoyltransferase complex transferase subunit TsaD [Oceanibacterium hippocampi]|uniref:tRNA N6-adenosine threonylcarbamoyltransferase n=1 Tax=Oceanibacterium hippocampi TaxID=745714 RepID=A0A1Y5RE45_9PROT|nr:tRNA (adenosine(37)-N6)-threonylcarbamoyltransferase complex transferase subunit TsaD [Oceanibacterium hippocampi]SLN15303.1 tRNA N6-adenosine threonylcarbamoyltransferase [Oceanibacterium hippocampi]
MLILGIETSCDETAAAIVDSARPAGARVLADVVLSQLDEHRPYGGVVPEIAARAHIDHLDRLIAQAMDEAGLTFADLDAVAATAGPGLIGGVIVGLMTAKAIAAAAGKPLVAVNHLEGHALTARLTGDIAFPYLLLLVSGGHSQILVVEGVGRYRRLGTTIDDAIGEAFDKSAKMLGLGYPGGPALEAMARQGDPGRYDLPRPMLGRDGADFSFSGLKTAVRQTIERLGEALDEQARRDICAAFQVAVGDVVADRLGNAIRTVARPADGRRPTLVVAGGVAANGYLRQRLADLAGAEDYELAIPPQRLCTDNGAMIAWAGAERLAAGLTDPLDYPARARWPLDPEAEPRPFAGVKA